MGSKAYEGSALPPALERVFAWLEEVEDSVRKVSSHDEVLRMEDPWCSNYSK